MSCVLPGDGHVTLAELRAAMESEGNADILSEIERGCFGNTIEMVVDVNPPIELTVFGAWRLGIL